MAPGHAVDGALVGAGYRAHAFPRFRVFRPYGRRVCGFLFVVIFVLVDPETTPYLEAFVITDANETVAGSVEGDGPDGGSMGFERRDAAPILYFTRIL